MYGGDNSIDYVHWWMRSWFPHRPCCSLQAAILHGPHPHPVLQGDALRLEGRGGDEAHQPQPAVEANFGQIRMQRRVLQLMYIIYALEARYLGQRVLDMLT